MLAAKGFPCDGLLLLAFPLHPAGKPGELRTERLPRIVVPVLCINGSLLSNSSSAATRASSTPSAASSSGTAGDGRRCYTVLMSTDQLEAELLRLPPRERLALAAWESLEQATAWLADPQTDREGIEIAKARDGALESGQVSALSIEEFRRRTRPAGE
jgi:hypothetical protein